MRKDLEVWHHGIWIPPGLTEKLLHSLSNSRYTSTVGGDNASYLYIHILWKTKAIIHIYIYTLLISYVLITLKHFLRRPDSYKKTGAITQPYPWTHSATPVVSSGMTMPKLVPAMFDWRSPSVFSTLTGQKNMTSQVTPRPASLSRKLYNGDVLAPAWGESRLAQSTWPEPRHPKFLP